MSEEIELDLEEETLAWLTKEAKRLGISVDEYISSILRAALSQMEELPGHDED